MKLQPWKKAIPKAAALLLAGLGYIEIQAKVREFGWNIQEWPLELSFLTDSPGHALFFVLFIIPLFGAFTVAAARHSEKGPE